MLKACNVDKADSEVHAVYKKIRSSSDLAEEALTSSFMRKSTLHLKLQVHQLCQDENFRNTHLLQAYLGSTAGVCVA